MALETFFNSCFTFWVNLITLFVPWVFPIQIYVYTYFSLCSFKDFMSRYASIKFYDCKKKLMNVSSFFTLSFWWPLSKEVMWVPIKKKSRIRETKQLSTDADSSTAAKKLLSIFKKKSLPAAIAADAAKGLLRKKKKPRGPMLWKL